MKTKFLSPFQVIAFVATASIHQANADSATWNGTTDALWATSTNWTSDPNPVPGAGNTATFANAGNANIVIDLGAGVTIGSIVYDTSSVAAYTLGSGGVGAQALTLGDSGSFTLNSTISANQTVNANLTLGSDGSAQSYAITNSDSGNSISFAGTVSGNTGGIAGVKTLNVTSASSTGVFFGGLISDGGATSLGIVKTGTGQLNLANVAHTFTGGVAVQEGFLNISASGSANNSTISLGAAGNTGSIVRIGVVNSTTNPASPLTVVAQTSGAATTRILGTNSSTSGQWSGPITMNGDLTVSTATAGAFTLQSAATVNLNSSTLTLSNSSTTTAINLFAKGKISGAGNVVVSNTSTGSPTLGLVIMEGDNDYTGSTTISAGTLQIGNNGATGSIANTSGISNSGTLDFRRTGTLNQGGPITGTGPLRLIASGTVTFDKANTYSGATSIGNGGKLIVATGGSIAPITGAALNVGFNSGAGTFQYDSASTSKFAGIVVGNGTSNAGTLNQTAGTINATSMTLNNGFSSTGIGTVNLSGGSLNLTGNISGSSQTASDGVYSTITVSGSAALAANTLFLTGSPSAGRFAANRVFQNGGTVTLSGGLTLARTTTANTAARRGDYLLNGGILTTPSVNRNAGTDTFGTFYFGGGTLKASAASPTFFEGLTAAYVYGNANINDDGNVITIAQPLLYTANDGVTSVTVTSGGTGYAASVQQPVTFSAPPSGRTATGIANVNGSGVVTSIVIIDPGTGYTSVPTFTIGGSGSGGTYSTSIGLPNGITSTGGGLVKSGVGTLTLSGASTYTGNTTVSAGTLSLGQINPSNEASTVSIAGAAFLNLGFVGIDTVDKLFINGVQQAAGDYTSAHVSGRFTGGGTLRVSTGPVAGYAAWAATPAFALAVADQDPTDDPDNDGMNNLLEFALNGNPSVSDPSINPKLVVTATDFEFTYQRRDDSVSPETTQTFQWGTTLAIWPGSVSISPLVASPTATVTVTPGTPSDAVTDTVKISIPKTEAGGSGKLFGRLQVVKTP